jgi:membrane-bound lytic murein transglycosylase MltF
LLKAIFQAESGGNLYPPNSSKGAMGPFQFTADTAKMLGINPYDPLQAEQGAEKYLTTLFEEFHDLTKVLAGYNWGPGFHKDIGMTLAQLFQQHPNDWQRYVPKETQDYIRKIEISMHLIPGASATVAAQQLAH